METPQLDALVGNRSQHFFKKRQISCLTGVRGLI